MPDNKTPDNEPVINDNEPTEVDETALYDAVSGAIDEVTITPEKTDDDENPDDDGDTDTGAAAAGETDDGDVSPEGSDDAGTAEDGDTEKSEVEKAADEKAAADAGDGDEAEAGNVPAEEDGEAGAKPKDGDDTPTETDPVNDPIPESTNEKTATRIKSLIELVKGKNESESQRDEIVERIQASGTDPEQYANTLGFLQMYNSTDTAVRKQALEVARGVVKELALELGEGASVTSLSDHEDLQAEVEAGTLTEVRAVEIASTRERQKLQDSRREAATVASDEVSTTQANIATGTGQLNELETALRSSDKNYAAIRPTFINMLKPILRRTHPTEWGEAAREVYDQVKLLTPAAKPKPKPKPKNEPLRPRGAAGGGSDKTTESDDVLSAVNDALANM